jgi:periplasmic protein TonB
MSKRLIIAITGSFVIHIIAYFLLMELDPDVTQHRRNWEVYAKKKPPPKKKIKFKPKKKPKKKVLEEKKAPPKPKPKPKVKKQPKKKVPKKTAPKQVDFTKIGLDGNSFGGNGIALPLGDSTMGDPEEKKPPPMKVVKVVPKVVVVVPKAKPVTLRSLPKPISVPRMSYPKAAREKGIQGTVKLRVTIGKTGRVLRVKLLKGIGHGLDELAIKALKKSKFKPAYGSDGKPMTYTIRYKYRFRIEED